MRERPAEALAAVPHLIGDLPDGRLGVLLALKQSEDVRPVLERTGQAVHRVAPESTVSVGTEVGELSQVVRSFRDAEQVADAIPPGTRGKDYYERSDIGLPELLYALRDDLRVQESTERRLAPLLDHDVRRGTNLAGSLRTHLSAAGNKTIAAQRDHLSRQAFYQRLRTIEQLLDCDLESGEQRARLHVAVTALDAHRRTVQGCGEGR